MAGGLIGKSLFLAPTHPILPTSIDEPILADRNEWSTSYHPDLQRDGGREDH